MYKPYRLQPLGFIFRHIFTAIVVSLLAAAVMILPAICAPNTLKNASASITSDILETVNGGQIDWENGYIYAKGVGVIPPASKVANRAIARLKASDYAKAEAVANLLMAIEGTAISYDGLGRDYMADVHLRQKIEGYVQNVELVDQKELKDKDGSYMVVSVRKAIFGKETPGAAFLEKIAADQAADPVLKTRNPRLIEIPVEKLPSERAIYLKADAGWNHFSGTVAQARELKGTDGPASSRPVDSNEKYEPAPQKGPFTGLIIDTRGYDVKRAMAPKIRKQNGEVVWGNVPVDEDLVLEKGVAAYVKSLEVARNNERAGSNPLLVISVGRAGGASMCDAVISDADGEKIVSENKDSKFLDKFNVIFVTDTSKTKQVSADPAPDQQKSAK